MISERLLTLRKQAGLSQQQVADAVGVTRQTVSNWELGQGAPALDRAAALARLYGVSIDDLANEEVGLVSSAGERPRRDLHVLHGLVGSAVQIELGADDLCFIPRATVPWATAGCGSRASRRPRPSGRRRPGSEGPSSSSTWRTSRGSP